MWLSPEYITAISTAIYVLMTLVIIIQNRFQRLNEKKQHLDAYGPHIIIYLTMNRGVMVLRIHNVGKRLAKKVNIVLMNKISCESSKINPNHDLELLSKSEFELGPDRYWDLMLCVPSELKKIVPSELDFRINYESLRETKNVTIHLNSYDWARYPEDEIVESIKKIEKVINEAKTANKRIE